MEKTRMIKSLVRLGISILSFVFSGVVLASVADLYDYSPEVILSKLPPSLKCKYEKYDMLEIPKRIEWLHDYNNALQLAKEEKKDLFMVFCRDKYEPCRKIYDLLNTDKLKKFVSQYVCVEIYDDELNVWDLYGRPPSGTLIIMDWNGGVYYDSHMGMTYWNQTIYDMLPDELQSRYNPLCVKWAKWKIPIGMDKKDVIQRIEGCKVTKRFVNENGVIYCIFENTGKKYEVPRSFKNGKQICSTAGWTFKPITVKYEMIVCFLRGLICGGATYIYFDGEGKVIDVFQGGT